MIEKRTVSFSKLFFGAALVSQLVVTQAFAQVDEEPILIRLNQVEVKPDMVGQFRAMHRDFWMPSSRAAGTPWRQVNRTVIGNTMQMVVATPIANMAALGGQPSNMTDAARNLAGDRTSETLLSRRSIVLTSRPDLSMEGIPNTGLSTVIHFQLKAGQNMAFAKFMTDMALPAMKASGVRGARMFETTTGGPSGEFWLTVPQTSYAALDGPGPFSSLTPQQGMELTAMGAELFESWDTSLARTDQELSYGLPGLQP